MKSPIAVEDVLLEGPNQRPCRLSHAIQVLGHGQWPIAPTSRRALGTALVLALLFSQSLAIEVAGDTMYFDYQAANSHLPATGGIAPTAGGNIGTNIRSPNGLFVLQQSAIGATVAAFPEGKADGYKANVEWGDARLAQGIQYKAQDNQDGINVVWDLRFPGVVNLDSGQQWPLGSLQPANFDEEKVKQAAEYYRVAIRANPFDASARNGLVNTYTERILAHTFAGNNAAQYASKIRWAGAGIGAEIAYWEMAVNQYRMAADVLAEATGLLPDAATCESELYTNAVQNAFAVFTRALGYEADAVRSWLRLSYFSIYNDPLTGAFNPGPLLASLQPHLDHMQSMLLLASRFTHLPNYLELDLPSVNATLALLHKQKNLTIPRGMISFVGQRSADNSTEVIGEYAPEYVPFLFLDSPTSKPTSFENILDEANRLLEIAGGDEANAWDNARAFDRDRAALTAKLDDIFSRYNDELGQLCGLIYGGGSELHPDVIGSLLPPGDREAERPFQSGESSGRIYAHYLVINETLLQVEAAEQDRHNIYLKAVNARTVGELIANQSENLAQMYLTDGASLAALERLRGKETARITREIARKQAEEAERQRKKALWGDLTALVGAAAVTLIFPPAGFTSGAAAFGAASGGFGASGYNIWAENANAHGNITLTLNAADLQAQLAEITANIEAQKQLIHSTEAATVQFAQRDQVLWKTEEAWQAAMLDYERAALNVLMAEQRLLMQKAELANLHSRVAYLLQEMRKSIILNTQTINPLARPDYRLWQDYTYRSAEESFLKAQEWLYLAAKAAQYKVNGSASVANIGDRIEASLRARRSGRPSSGCGLDSLCDIASRLHNDINTLYLNQGTPTTALSIPLRIRNYIVQNNYVAYDAQGNINPALSLMEVQSNGSNTVAVSDAAWLEFLQSHVTFQSVPIPHTRLEIPFSTSLNPPKASANSPGFDPSKLRTNPLFSDSRYSDLISFASGSASAFGIRINVRGRNLMLDPNLNIVASLRQEGASYQRTGKWANNPEAIRLWNLKPVEGVIICSANGTGAASLSTPQFHERSAANDRWVLIIDTLEGAGANNAALLSQLQNITDIELTFSIKGFTN